MSSHHATSDLKAAIIEIVTAEGSTDVLTIRHRLSISHAEADRLVKELAANDSETPAERERLELPAPQLSLVPNNGLNFDKGYTIKLAPVPEIPAV